MRRVIAEQRTAEKEVELPEKQAVLQDIKNKIENSGMAPEKETGHY
jgi:hypothetical protein